MRVLYGLRGGGRPRVHTERTDLSEASNRTATRLVALIVVAGSLAALAGIGEAACALGLALAAPDVRDGRRIAAVAVAIVTTIAYAFIPVVGHRGGHLALSLVGYVASVVLATLPALGAFVVTERLATSLEARACVLPMAWALLASIVPAVFPFKAAYLAVTSLPLSQWLAVGGPAWLDAIVVGAGTSLVVLRRGAPEARGLAAIFLIGAFGGGAAMLVHARAVRRPSLDVGIVAPATTLDDARGVPRAERLASLHALTEQVRHADLVVWPESIYPHRIREDATRDAPAPAGVREAIDPPVLAGAHVGDRGCETFSSFVAVDRRGLIRGRIDKTRRMPFGDVVPWRVLPFVAARFPCATRPGERFAPITIARARVGGLLCYDEVAPDVARERVLAGAEVLVSGSNDAWYAGTLEPWLHARVARARAIETRRDLVRAVNLGEGGLIASTGEPLLVLRGDVPEARVARVALARGITPAVRVGPLVPAIFFAILGLLALRLRRAAEAGRA